MTIESALVPLPSEITMPFSGFLASKGELSFPLIVLAGAFGNLTGSLILYYLGFFLEEKLILSIIDKYGKIFLLTRHDYQQSLSWFRKYGEKIAFFSRLLPGIRTFISLPAGFSEMNVVKFSIYSFFGSLIWSSFLTFIGFYLGRNWNSLEGYYRKFEIGIAVLLILGVLFYINHKLRIIKFSH